MTTKTWTHRVRTARKDSRVGTIEQKIEAQFGAACRRGPAHGLRRDQCAFGQAHRPAPRRVRLKRKPCAFRSKLTPCECGLRPAAAAQTTLGFV